MNKAVLLKGPRWPLLAFPLEARLGFAPSPHWAEPSPRRIGTASVATKEGAKGDTDVREKRQSDSGQYFLFEERTRMGTANASSPRSVSTVDVRRWHL